MEKPNLQLELNIKAWRYAEVLQETIDNPGYSFQTEDLPWIVAALSFTGRIVEAQSLYASRSEELTEDTRIIARFFLGLGVCRAKREDDAKRIFLDNLIAFSKFKGSEKAKSLSITEVAMLHFYAVQGLAFLRYSNGYLKKAFFWSERSLQAATASMTPYASIFAHEISGHILLQLGSVQRGMKHLDIARAKAEAGGLGSLALAMDASKKLYSATYGVWDAQSTLTELNEGLVRCKFEDSYTRAGLNIQLAHAMVLCGRLEEALECLEKASSYVYQADNPYLESIYNLTLAYIQVKKGELHVALSIAKTGSKHESGRTHLPSRLKALGLQSDIMRMLGLPREKMQIDEAIRSLTKKTGGLVARRILSRRNDDDVVYRRGEDPLGDLLDDLKAEKIGVLKDVFKSGWLGFLYEALKIGREEQVIYLDLEPSSLTLFQNGNVYHKTEGSTDLIRKTLLILNQHREVNKELFTQKLWGQDYNPLRHDNLIYGLVARTRKVLAPHPNLIEATEEGYCLSESVVVRTYKAAVQPKAPEAALIKDFAVTSVVESSVREEGFTPASMSLLSLRQIQILEWVGKSRTIQPKDLIEGLKVSDATATRDLGKLVELGFLVRRGHGRATFYTLLNQEH